MNEAASTVAVHDPPLPAGLSERDVQRAIRLSYGQAMLGSVYGASTGGMFLTGYALLLGAGNLGIGLMSTIPMLGIGVQLAVAALVERGVSRRRLTFTGAIANVLCWLLVILIPYLFADSPARLKVGLLISVIAMVTLFAYISGNARGSWVGDLIPARFRGKFFGRITMYSGLVGAVFAILEGRLLDRLEALGIGAFGCLFGFGVVVGLVNALLFLPQADVPIQRPPASEFGRHFKATFRNGPFMSVMAFTLLWSLQSVAGPFYVTYMIRDLEMPFFGIGLVNSVVIVAMLASAPGWGRIVDRYGCRAVLTVCSSTLGLLQLSWLAVDSAFMAYCVIAPANIFAGLSIGGVSVALSTLVYKVTPSAGRAVQFAVYSVIVTLAAAPMPIVGGWLPDLLSNLLPASDLRLTFYACLPLLIGASCVARRIREPDARRARDLLRFLPIQMIELWQRFAPMVFPLGKGSD